MGLDACIEQTWPLDQMSWHRLEAHLHLVGATPIRPSDTSGSSIDDCERIASYGGFHQFRCWVACVWTEVPPFIGSGEEVDDGPLKTLWRNSGTLDLGGHLEELRPITGTPSMPIAGLAHLLFCNDSDAIFVPWNFEHPVYVRLIKGDGQEHAQSIGSIAQILQALDWAAARMQLPDDLDPNAHWNADAGGPVWLARPTIGHACNMLRALCRVAASRAAFLQFW